MVNFEIIWQIIPRGQIISEVNCGVLNLPKKQRNHSKNFCPSQKNGEARASILQITIVGFLQNLTQPKFPSNIIWPLVFKFQNIARTWTTKTWIWAMYMIVMMVWRGIHVNLVHISTLSISMVIPCHSHNLFSFPIWFLLFLVLVLDAIYILGILDFDCSTLKARE